MSLLLLGLHHTVAPVAVRARRAVSPGRLPELLATLRARRGVREVAVLSTGNRFAIYEVVADVAAGKTRCGGSLGTQKSDCVM